MALRSVSEREYKDEVEGSAAIGPGMARTLCVRVSLNRLLSILNRDGGSIHSPHGSAREQHGICLYLINLLIAGLFSVLPVSASAAGSVAYLLSSPPSDALSSVTRKEDVEYDAKWTTGLLTDFLVVPGGSVAVDFYSFRENLFRFNNGALVDLEELFLGFSIGFRWHIPSGLYMGPALVTMSHLARGSSRSTTVIGISDENLVTMGLTGGYRHVFSSGFMLGAHLFYSAPADLMGEVQVCRSVICTYVPYEERDVSFRLLGLSLGYAW